MAYQRGLGRSNPQSAGSVIDLLYGVKHAFENTQNDCHRWLSDSSRVHQNCFFWPGFCPDPAGGAYNPPLDPLAGVRGNGEGKEKGKGEGWNCVDPPFIMIMMISGVSKGVRAFKPPIGRFRDRLYSVKHAFENTQNDCYRWLSDSSKSAPNLFLAGVVPRTPLGELTALAQIL